MSIEVQNIQRLRAYVEPAGSFAVDNTGSLGSFIDIPFVEGTAAVTLTTEMLPTNLAQQHMDAYALDMIGKQSCALNFQTFLAGTGVAANASTSAVQGPLGLLLKTIMGGESLAMGSAVATGTSESAFDVDAGEGARFSAGVGVAVPIDGALHARELKSVATDTLTTKIALPDTPDAEAVVYRAASYYLTEDPDTSLQFVIEGAEGDDRWVMRGLQGGFTLELQPGQPPTITFNLTGTSWDNLGAGSIAVATYANTVPFAIQDSQLLVPTVGTATLAGAEVHASAIEFTSALAYVPVTSPGGVETVYRWRRNRVAPVMSGTFTTFYEDTTWFTARDNKTAKAIAYQIGNAVPSATLGTMLLTAPTVQVTDVQRVADGAGLAGQTVTWKARLDTDADQSTALGRSAFRIHRW